MPLLLAGCAMTPPEDPSAEVRQITADRTGGQVVQWNRSTDDDRAAHEAVRRLLDKPLAADTAVQVALLNNANLQATYEDLGVAQADLVQAGLLRNPIFEGQIRFPPDPKSPLELDVFWEFMDVFYLPLRKRVAAAQLDVAKARVTKAALDLASDTRSAFYTVQAQAQMLEMRRQVADATEAAAAAAREIRRAGNIKDVDVTEQETLAGQARLDRDSAEAELVQDRERLSVLMGLSGAEAHWSIDGRLSDPPATEPARDRLEAYALDRRMDLVAARREVEAASQSLGLTRASRLFPDARIGAHFEREPQGEKTVGPSIELPIPLIDQGQGRVAREYALFRQARRRYEAMTAEAQSQVRAAQARVAAAQQRADYYRTAVLPLNARLLEQSQRQFNAMQIGVFQLIQAKQSQIEAGRAYIESLRDYWLARTELEKAVGGRLP